MRANDRREALRKVIGSTEPISDAFAALRRFSWDSEQTLVDMYRTDATRVLRRFLDKQFSAEQCVEWADALESRDDVGYEKGHEVLLRQFLFELANPLISTPLSTELAHAWIRRFEGAGGLEHPTSSIA